MRTTTIAAWTLVGLLLSAPTHAQVLGTFTWQTQPFCNVLQLVVIQQGGVYQVTGVDTLCGGGTAPVTGTAAPGGAGVVMGLTVSLPDGSATQLTASISLASISGTWTDADGNGGTFAFNQATGGAPRPAPAKSTAITVNQLSPTVYGGSGAAATVARSDHTHDDRYFTEAEVTAQLAGKAGTSEIVTITGTGGSTEVAEVTILSRNFTTTVAGRLDVQLSFLARITCAANANSERTMFLLVNGQVLLGSLVLRSGFTPGDWDFFGTLSGITTAVVPAGTHTLSVGAQCTGASVAGNTLFGPSNGVVTVIR